MKDALARSQACVAVAAAICRCVARRVLPARRIEFVDDAWAAFRYEFPVTEMVRAAKFHGDLNALEVLASGFTDEFLTYLGEVDVLVPVPLLPWRFLRRGFNQAGELGQR